MHSELDAYLLSLQEIDEDVTDHGYVVEQLRLQASDLQAATEFTSHYFHGVTDVILKLLVVCLEGVKEVW